MQIPKTAVMPLVGVCARQRLMSEDLLPCLEEIFAARSICPLCVPLLVLRQRSANDEYGQLVGKRRGDKWTTPDNV